VSTTQRARRVIYNSGMLILAQGLEISLGVVIIGFVARYLGQQGLGTYGFVMSLGQVFVVAGQMGLPRILVREVSRDKAETAQYLGNAVSVISVAMGLALLAATVLTWLIAADGDVALAMTTYFMSEFILAAALLGYSVFRAYERMEYQAIISVVGQTVKVVLALLFIYMDLGLVALFVAMCVANAWRLFMVQYVLRKRFVAARPRWSPWLIRFLVLSGLPVAASFFFRAWAWEGPIVILRIVQGEAQVGLVFGPLRVVENVRILVYSFVSSVLPLLSHQFVARWNAFLTTLQGALKVALMGGVLIALVISALADPIVLLLLGPEFSQSAEALLILGWVTAFAFPGILLGATLVATNAQVVETVSLFVALVISLSVSMLLIPTHGFSAVGYAVLLGEASSFALALVFLWRRTSLAALPKATIGILAPGALAGLLIHIARPYNPYMALVLGLLLFCGGMLLLRTFDEDERRLLGRVFSTSRQNLQSRDWNGST
jgi:O-antigen/teichoic acid export membrane protein